MLFYSFFKSLIGQPVCVCIKATAAGSGCDNQQQQIKGTLQSVDQFYNLKLAAISSGAPHLQGIKSLFIRGSVVASVQFAAAGVDADLLQDACRKEIAARNKA